MELVKVTNSIEYPFKNPLKNLKNPIETHIKAHGGLGWVDK